MKTSLAFALIPVLKEVLSYAPFKKALAIREHADHLITCPILLFSQGIEGNLPSYFLLVQGECRVPRFQTQVILLT